MLILVLSEKEVESSVVVVGGLERHRKKDLEDVSGVAGNRSTKYKGRVIDVRGPF